MSDSKRKPLIHHKVEPGSSVYDRKTFQHNVKPGSSFPPEGEQEPPRTKELTLRDVATPEMFARYPKNHPMWDYILSPSEKLTWKRMQENRFESIDLVNLEAMMAPDRTFSPDALSLPSVTPLPHNRPRIKPALKTDRRTIAGVHDRISKRRSRIKRNFEIRRHGPQGEMRSRAIAGRLTMISLDQILADPDFRNIRLDPDPEELARLTESIRQEGLKVPITVIPVPGEKDLYYLRSGFRRTEAILFLKWHQIPAIVLPVDTPEEDEYWANIIENSARQQLHTYEIAKATQTMRDMFQINYRDFALRAGYSDKYVDNLLRAIDRLPDCILERWQNKVTKIPVDYYVAWSSMMPDEAVKSFNIFAGLHPHIEHIRDKGERSSGESDGDGRSAILGGDKDTSPPTKPLKHDNQSRYKITNAFEWKRMAHARLSIESTPILDEPTRKVCLKIIDFCMGSRDDIPGIHDHKSKMRMARNRKHDKSDPDDE